MRLWKSGLILGISAITMVVAYQNCGQSLSDSQTRASSEEPESEIDFPVSAMIDGASSSSKIDAKSCEFEQLQCLRKVYSPAVDDLQTDEVLCLDEVNAQHCLKVNSVYYNTSSALQVCAECTAEDVKMGGRYNREEVTCWTGSPAAGPEAVFALRSNFREAAEAVLASCGGGK